MPFKLSVCPKSYLKVVTSTIKCRFQNIVRSISCAWFSYPTNTSCTRSFIQCFIAKNRFPDLLIHGYYDTKQMILLQAVFLSVISLTNSVDASMRFRGRDIRDVVREVNTSSSFGYFSECGEFSADTQVLFNDTVAGGEGPCAGDAGFLYGKSVDHASLGSDAAIDKVLSSGPAFTFYTNESSPHILTTSDVRNNWSGTVNLDGFVNEFAATP